MLLLYVHVTYVGGYLALPFQTVQRSTIAMLLTVQVVASLGRPIVPWSIIELNDENTTFDQLFQMIQAGSFDIIQMNDECLARLLVQRGIP